MILQILIETDNRYLSDVLSFLRRHAGQFGDARDFMAWGKKHSNGLVRFLVPAGSPKAYLFDASQPAAGAMAICPEDSWTLEPGRVLHYGGKLVCSLTSYPIDPGSASPAEVDGLARRIVAMLNEKGVGL